MLAHSFTGVPFVKKDEADVFACARQLVRHKSVAIFFLSKNLHICVKKSLKRSDKSFTIRNNLSFYSAETLRRLFLEAPVASAALVALHRLYPSNAHAPATRTHTQPPLIESAAAACRFSRVKSARRAADDRGRRLRERERETQRNQTLASTDARACACGSFGGGNVRSDVAC